MTQEERFSGKRGLQGCLVAWGCMIVGSLVILVLYWWTGLRMSFETDRVVFGLLWYLAVGLGGYFAARFGKTTGWTNSLMVGLLADLYLIGKQTKSGPGQMLLEPFLEMIEDPGAHWPRLVQLALTIPIAILGGFIWQATGGVKASRQGEPDAANKSAGTE